MPTKSGVMVGLGETDDEILQVMRDMRAHDIDMLTIGQYLAPSGHHLPVRRYVHPDTFRMFEREAAAMGFTPRRRRRAGALELPRRPAGARGGRRRHAPDAGGCRPPLRPDASAARLRQLPRSRCSASALARPLRARASRSTSAPAATWSGSTAPRPRGLNGPGLLELIGTMAARYDLPHQLLTAATRCPRCAGQLKTVHNQLALGPLGRSCSA